MRFSVFRLAGLLCTLLSAAAVCAQVRYAEHVYGPAMVCALTAPDGSYPQVTSRYANPESHVRFGTVFEVTYNSFPPEAEAAFQAAVEIWEQHITSPTPIRINASWIPLSGNVLGSAGPFLVRNFDAAPIPNTWYPAALANALDASDLDPSTPEIEATFNSDFSGWYFGTDGMPPSDQFDLTTIVLHEIGHGLGFIGAFTVENGLGTVGVDSNPGIPFVYDRYAEDGEGQSLLDTATYPQNSTVLANVLQTATYLGGGTVEATHGGPAPLYSPSAWNGGSSYSHFDEDEFPRDDVDGLMTPFLRQTEVIRSPGPLACAVLQDIGWTLAPACATLVEEGQAPVVIPGGFAVTPSGPNPFTGETELRISVEQAQAVEFRLLDRMGRVVIRQDRYVQSGATATFQVPANDLAAGVYFVYIAGESFTTTRALTKVR